MISKAFFKDLAERAIKSFVQGVATYLTLGGTATLLSLGEIDWLTAIESGVVMSIYSVLTSIGSSGFGNPDSASLVNQVEEDE